MYIFVTKVESGGQFWRILFNRFLSAMALAMLTLAIVVWAQFRDLAAWAMVPLAPIFIIFKVVAHRTFDRKMEYYQANMMGDNALKQKEEGASAAHGRLERRFGHPALTKPLLRPMVHAKAQHVLPQIGLGIKPVDDHRGSSGIPLDDLQTNTRDANGKKAKRVKKQKSGMFQIVNDSQLDFTDWANAPEFAEQLAASNGTEIDSVRSRAGTPTIPGSRPISRVGSPAGFDREPRSASPAGYDRQSRLMTPGGYENNSRSASPSGREYHRQGPGLIPHFPSNDPGYVPLTTTPSPLPSPYPYGDDPSRPYTPSYDVNASAQDAYGQNLLAGPPPGGRRTSGYIPDQNLGPYGGHHSPGASYEDYRKGGGGGGGGQGWR